MSIRYQLAEFYDTTLDRSQDFGFQVADQARRGLCSLWGATPGALIPNPGDSFRRGAISALCQDFPPPSPPSVPFLGGQCPGGQYNVAVGIGFTQGNGTVVPPSNPGVRIGPYLGPLSVGQRRVGDVLEFFNEADGKLFGSVTVGGNFANSRPTIQLYDIVRIGGTDNCGNPPPEYPGSSYVDDRDTTIEGDTIVEGDENNPITIDISPTFEDEVCIGTFVFCADVEGNRVTLDAGGITINLPGTGGGDSGGSGGGGDGDTITNIDTKVTNIQEAQEECCSAIIQSISSFRNRATELFNEAELRDACIVGLIRNATETVPRFVGPADVRATGSTGVLGSVRVIQPSRGDSCFLRIEITPTLGFKGKRYKILDDGDLVEASFGHAELVFLDGTTIPPAEAGIRTISSRKSYIWFPYVSSGNAIRLSLAGGLDYTVTDPGFRWSPKDLPTCEEVIDPGP